MKKTYIGELIATWGAAAGGSAVGSVMIGIVGVLLVRSTYPQSEFEQGAALVGALFGSLFSIPIGFVAGMLAGPLIFFAVLNRNGWRPVVVAAGSAFVLSALVSGVILVPVGFIFYGVGHI